MCKEHYIICQLILNSSKQMAQISFLNQIPVIGEFVLKVTEVSGL